MVRYLLNRPIAVGMLLLALIAGGLVSFFSLPVSLMPNIDIPVINIQVQTNGLTPEAVEKQIAAPLRNRLRQAAGVKQISGKTTAAGMEMSLKFEYGTNIDLAFIEVNEKVDASINLLPTGIARPDVIKSSITDIPVMYLNISNIQAAGNQTEEQELVELSDFVSNVVVRRLEQIPQIAVADASGLVFTELQFIPKRELLESLGISAEFLLNELALNKYFVSTLSLTEGNYTYSVKLKGGIQTAEELKKIPINHRGQFFLLSELADTRVAVVKQKGAVVSGGRQQISLAIIMRESARSDDLQANLDKLTQSMISDYPNLKFTAYNDQTRLLNYALDNIWSTFLIGTLLASVLSLLFSYNRAAAVLIGLTIPVGVVINFVFFTMFNISINLLSVAGLVFGIGLMIDNAIIVTDNIARLMQIGFSKKEACITGTNEIIAPMLSSTLTSMAVFLPLVMYPGVGGTLFFVQAVSVGITLFTSFLLSITVLPVFAHVLYKPKQLNSGNRFAEKLQSRIIVWYEKALIYCFRKPAVAIASVFIVSILGFITFFYLPITDFPELKYPDMMVKIRWNENVSLESNLQRAQKLLEQIKPDIEFETSFVGIQQFRISHTAASNHTDALSFYIQTQSHEKAQEAWLKLQKYLNSAYPKAFVQKQSAGNSFESVFARENATIIELGQIQNKEMPKVQWFNAVLDSLENQLQLTVALGNTVGMVYELQLNANKMRLYSIEKQLIYTEIQKHTGNYKIVELSGTSRSIPVVFGTGKIELNELKNIKIHKTDGTAVPLFLLADLVPVEEFNELYFNENGVYYPVTVTSQITNQTNFIQKVSGFFSGQFLTSFSGSYFTGKQNLLSMVNVLVFSLLLLFLILAAQFESIVLPLIILIELPVDIFGAFICLKIFDMELDIMALIGIIVMSGIVINDSILKIDAIRQLEHSGKKLIPAIFTGGKNRLMSILLTTATTVLAVIPFLLSSGIGNELQAPMTVVLVGGLLAGLPVSIFIIPLVYYRLQKNKK